MTHQKTHSLQRGQRSRWRNCNGKNIRLKKNSQLLRYPQ